MTPEALRAYLVTCGCDEDAIQHTILRYLESLHAVRYPKSWAWKVARRYQAKVEINQELGEWVEQVTRSEPDPLRVAIARQELARALANPPKPKRGRPRNGGLKGCLEDAQALLKGDIV